MSDLCMPKGWKFECGGMSGQVFTDIVVRDQNNEVVMNSDHWVPDRWVIELNRPGFSPQRQLLINGIDFTEAVRVAAALRGCYPVMPPEERCGAVVNDRGPCMLPANHVGSVHTHERDGSRIILLELALERMRTTGSKILELAKHLLAE